MKRDILRIPLFLLILAGPAFGDDCRCKPSKPCDCKPVLNFGVDTGKLKGGDAGALLDGRIAKLVENWTDFPERIEANLFIGSAVGMFFGVFAGLSTIAIALSGRRSK